MSRPTAPLPLTFSGTVGLLQPATGQPTGTAVLFLGSFGLEDMCLRAFWRRTAEVLSTAGTASLRFDYPGTGDALDPADAVVDLASWEEAVLQAALLLKRRTGVQKLLLVGHGLGAMLGVRVSGRIEGLAGLACLAPVVSGRAYLRELQIWSRMVDEGLGLAPEHRISGGVSIGGHILPEALAGTLKQVTLANDEEIASVPILVASRSDRPADAAFAESLIRRSLQVTEVIYEGYDSFVANPSRSRLSNSLVEALVTWIAAVAGPRVGAVVDLVSTPEVPVQLTGEEFVERPVLFGAQLYGIECLPIVQSQPCRVILLGTGYDRHAGWGRSGVNLARDLARAGIASLRFDAASVADSPARAEAPAQVLYSDVQEHDVREAIDWCARHPDQPIVLVGRCSGAYLAFRSAIADERVRGVVCANPFVFEWDRTLDVDAALAGGARSLDDYGARLIRPETLGRILRGEIDLQSAAKNILKRLFSRAGVLLQPMLQHLSLMPSRHRSILNAFRLLQARGVGIELVYSRGDVGYDHFAELFGRDGAGLRKMPLARLTVIEEADHNLSPAFAREAYLNRIIELCRRVEAAS